MPTSLKHAASTDMVKPEQARKKDFRETAQGFGVCTAAVLILYLISGMDAVNMREMHLSLLMALLTACCAFYVTSAFTSSKKRFLSLISALPAFGIYFLIFRFRSWRAYFYGRASARL